MILILIVGVGVDCLFVLLRFWGKQANKEGRKERSFLVFFVYEVWDAFGCFASCFAVAITGETKDVVRRLVWVELGLFLCVIFKIRKPTSKN